MKNSTNTLGVGEVRNSFKYKGSDQPARVNPKIEALKVSLIRSQSLVK